MEEPQVLTQEDQVAYRRCRCHCPRAQPPLTPPSAELSGTSVFSRTGSPQEERAGDFECFSPRTGPGKGRRMRTHGSPDAGFAASPQLLPADILPTVPGSCRPPSAPGLGPLLFPGTSIQPSGQPMVPAPPFRPTKAQVSLQPRAGPAWLPRLLSRALAVSLRWKEPSSWGDQRRVVSST